MQSKHQIDDNRFVFADQHPAALKFVSVGTGDDDLQLEDHPSNTALSRGLFGRAGRCGGGSARMRSVLSMILMRCSPDLGDGMSIGFRASAWLPPCRQSVTKAVRRASKLRAAYHPGPGSQSRPDAASPKILEPGKKAGAILYGSTATFGKTVVQTARPGRPALCAGTIGRSPLAGSK